MGGKWRRTVGPLGAWTADEKIVRLDVPIDEVLLMYRLHSGDLRTPSEAERSG